MRILYKYATRQRPALFRQVLDRYYAFQSGLHPFRFVVSCDEDDASMNNDDIRAFVSAHAGAEIHFNPQPQTKVSAINANIPADEWDVLFTVSDDMVPVVKGFDDVIVNDMHQFFADTDGALWYMDGRRTDLNTLSILGRRYFDRFGHIYEPSYHSFFCDDEHHQVASAMGKLARIDRVIVAHAWVEVTGTDPLYHKNNVHYRTDEVTFQARKAAGFPGYPVPAATAAR